MLPFLTVTKSAEMISFASTELQRKSVETSDPIINSTRARIVRPLYRQIKHSSAVVSTSNFELRSADVAPNLEINQNPFYGGGSGRFRLRDRPQRVLVSRSRGPPGNLGYRYTPILESRR